MSQQDDERIARKLLDLGSRSDRVQIRNGMTYLDGYALGNGTVEIRSQVARDRRRRFIPEVGGYAAAILYEVVNGTNSEIWLQDDGAAPVLITTLPRRIALGWSVTVPPARGFLGYFLPARLWNDTSLDPRPISNAIPGTISEPNMLAIYNTTTELDLAFGLAPFWQSIAGEYYLSAPGGGSTELYAGSSILFAGTVTVESVANMIACSLQRRRTGTYVYLRQTHYHSQSTPVPNLTTGNVWMNAQYWANGTLFTDTLTPDPSDITGSVLNAPLRQRLTVDDPASPLNGQWLNNGVNLYSPTESARVFNLSDFLTTEENQGTAEVAVFIGPPGVIGAQSQQRFSCAPANARQILSVAVYPRG